jgi:hypothetical protein
MLMLETNAKVIQACKDELAKTSLVGWAELLENVALAVHLSNKESV